MKHVPPSASPAARAGLRLAVVAPYRFVPADSGGKALIAGGCRELARQAGSVHGWALRTARERGPAATAGFPYVERTAWSSALIAFAPWGLTKVPFWAAQGRWARRLAREILAREVDLVEVHMPWLMTLRAHLPRHVPVVYHAQNVEALWYADALAASPLRGPMTAWLEALERRAVRTADRTAVLTRQDASEICRRYGVPEEKVWVLPPGFDPVDLPVARPRAAGRKITALFVGSLFSGNVEAVRDLCRVVAPAVADAARLVIAGRVCDAFRGAPCPPNVEWAGFVPDPGSLFDDADVFLNPSRMNTGINIKVLDALARGVLVLSTLEGARGYEHLAGRSLQVARLEEFGAALRAAAPPSAASVREAMAFHAWPRVVADRLERYRRLVDDARTGGRP
jgi:glycosyltransferase involved in cell wall biosynthesis